LQVSYRTDTADVDKKWASRFVERLYTSMVSLSVELGKAELTGRDVISLKKGDVIPLDTHIMTRHVFVEDVLKFRGVRGVTRETRPWEIVACTDKKGPFTWGRMKRKVRCER
jgi:flagellar motor switch protein FliM